MRLFGIFSNNRVAFLQFLAETAFCEHKGSFDFLGICDLSKTFFEKNLETKKAETFLELKFRFFEVLC